MLPHWVDPGVAKVLPNPLRFVNLIGVSITLSESVSFSLEAKSLIHIDRNLWKNLVYSHRMEYTNSQGHSPKIQLFQGGTFSCLKAKLHAEPHTAIREPEGSYRRRRRSAAIRELGRKSESEPARGKGAKVPQLHPRILTVLAALFFELLLLVRPGRGEKSTEPFYTQLSRLVIRLEHYEFVKKEGQSKESKVSGPDGTAFFVGDQDYLFVVTARHVAAKDHDLHARVPALVDRTGKTEVVELRLPRSRWVFHPNTGDALTHPVDVAVMHLPRIQDRSIVKFQYCPKGCPEAEPTQLVDDAVPPNQVFIWGFPLDIGFGLKEPRPMGRQGMVALNAEERFLTWSVKRR